jgi:alcohol dehydrogenase/propanol-preferring alcohol dehydrogenase
VGSAQNGLEYLVEALDVVARGEVRPMIETCAKEHIARAHDKAAAGEVRFDAVVTC